MQIFFIIILVLQTIVLLINGLVHKVNYSLRITYYFYLKIFAVFAVIFRFYPEGALGYTIGMFWGLFWILLIFEFFNNKKEIKYYKENKVDILGKRKKSKK